MRSVVTLTRRIVFFCAGSPGATVDTIRAGRRPSRGFLFTSGYLGKGDYTCVA